MRLLLGTATALLLLLLPGSLAMSQTIPQSDMARCMPHIQMAAELGDRFQEYKLGGGISVDGTLLELFASTSGTFTVLKTLPAGLSCIVDFGVGWQSVTPPEVEATRNQGDLTDRTDTY